MLNKTGVNLMIVRQGSLATVAKGTTYTPVPSKNSTEFIYFATKAIAGDMPNGNGDFFPWEHLLKSYSTFIGRSLFLNHNSDDPRNAIGKVLDAYPVIDKETGEKYIECLAKIDAVAHPQLARQVETGILDACSMGCSVESSQCSICGLTIHSDNDDKCQHMSSGLGKEYTAELDLPEMNIQKGSPVTAYAINRGLNFTELSVVNVPAWENAKIVQVIAKLKESFAEKQDVPPEAFKDLEEILKMASKENLEKKAEESEAIEATAPESTEDLDVNTVTPEDEGASLDKEAAHKPGCACNFCKNMKGKKKDKKEEKEAAKKCDCDKKSCEKCYPKKEAAKKCDCDKKSCEKCYPKKEAAKKDDKKEDKKDDKKKDKKLPWGKGHSKGQHTSSEETNLETVAEVIESEASEPQESRLKKLFKEKLSALDFLDLQAYMNKDIKKEATPEAASAEIDLPSAEATPEAVAVSETAPVEETIDTPEAAIASSSPEAKVEPAAEETVEVEAVTETAEEVEADTTPETIETIETPVPVAEATPETAPEAVAETAPEAVAETPTPEVAPVAESSQKTEHSLKAIFVTKANVKESYWVVTNNGKPVLKASLGDIWGEKLSEISDYASSPTYGEALLERIDEDGVKKVALLTNASIYTEAGDGLPDLGNYGGPATPKQVGQVGKGDEWPSQKPVGNSQYKPAQYGGAATPASKGPSAGSGDQAASSKSVGKGQYTASKNGGKATPASAGPAAQKGKVKGSEDTEEKITVEASVEKKADGEMPGVLPGLTPPAEMPAEMPAETPAEMPGHEEGETPAEEVAEHVDDSMCKYESKESAERMTHMMELMSAMMGEMEKDLKSKAEKTYKSMEALSTAMEKAAEKAAKEQEKEDAKREKEEEKAAKEQEKADKAAEKEEAAAEKAAPEESEAPKELETPAETPAEMPAMEKKAEEVTEEAPAETVEVAAEAEPVIETETIEETVSETPEISARERELEQQLMQLKVEQSLRTKTLHCRAIVDDMIEKDLIVADEEDIEFEVKEGKPLFDARAEAFKKAADKQCKDLLAMEETTLRAFAKTVSRMKSHTSATSEHKGVLKKAFKLSYNEHSNEDAWLDGVFGQMGSQKGRQDS